MITIKKYLVPIIFIAVITAGAGFVGGMKYQQSRNFRPSLGEFGRPMQFRNGQGNPEGGLRQQGMGGGMRPVSGEIISLGNNSVTVKLPDGSSKIVVLSDSTEIGEMTKVTADKLTVGNQVLVFGIANDDGSVTAQNVQLNPAN